MAHRHADESAAPAMSAIDGKLMTRVFYAFAALVILSAGISLAGRWFGASIAMAGYTDDRTLHEIVIGNNVVAAPSNAIRFERARRDGVANRLDLYLHWPDMEGYSNDTRADFNHTSGQKRILFLSFEERMMSRDMSGRFDPIYTSLIVRPGQKGPAGLTTYDFNDKSGYLDEVLTVAERPGASPFVARCLVGSSADESVAPCERDVHLGDDLSLTYRFPRELLAEWQAMDAAVTAKATAMLKTAR